MTALAWTDPRHPWMRDHLVLELPPLPSTPRRCEHCSGDMHHRRAGAIYCSDRCARRARCADRIGRTRVAACIECGASLAHRTLAAVYCSRRCERRGYGAGRLVRIMRSRA